MSGAASTDGYQAVDEEERRELVLAYMYTRGDKQSWWIYQQSNYYDVSDLRYWRLESMKQRIARSVKK